MVPIEALCSTFTGHLRFSFVLRNKHILMHSLKTLPRLPSDRVNGLPLHSSLATEFLLNTSSKVPWQESSLALTIGEQPWLPRNRFALDPSSHFSL